MEYIIVKKISSEYLESEVNKLIKEGYVASGGVATTGNMFYQAMVKDKVIKVVQ